MKTGPLGVRLAEKGSAGPFVRMNPDEFGDDEPNMNVNRLIVIYRADAPGVSPFGKPRQARRTGY